MKNESQARANKLSAHAVHTRANKLSANKLSRICSSAELLVSPKKRWPVSLPAVCELAGQTLA